MAAASDLVFHQIPVGEMANLAYLVGSRSAREALLVDPAWSVDALLDTAEAEGLRVVGALVTHYHQDHVGGRIFGHDIEGVARLLERAPVPIHVNEHEAEGTRQVTGASESDLVRHAAGDAIALGALAVRLLHTPGHTPGHHSLLVRLAQMGPVILSGDGVHFRENYDTNGVPWFNYDRAQTQASTERVKKLVENLKATLIIQHDARDVSKLPAYPDAAK